MASKKQKINKNKEVCLKCRHCINFEHGEFMRNDDVSIVQIPLCSKAPNDYTFLNFLYEYMNNMQRRVLFVSIYGKIAYTTRMDILLDWIVTCEGNGMAFVHNTRFDSVLKKAKKHYDQQRLKQKYCANIPTTCQYKMEHIVTNQ